MSYSECVTFPYPYGDRLLHVYGNGCLADKSDNDFSVIFTAIARDCLDEVEFGRGIYQRRRLSLSSPPTVLITTKRLVHIGEDAEADECFQSYRNLTISCNRNGQTAFRGQRCGDSNEGIWTRSADEIPKIRARLGETTDCGNTLSAFAGGDRPIAMNSSGTVVMSFDPLGGGSTLPGEATGLWQSKVLQDGNTELTSVARVGQPLRQLGNCSAVVAALGNQVAVNEFDQVVYFARFMEEYSIVSDCLIVYSPPSVSLPRGLNQIVMQTGDLVRFPRTYPPVEDDYLYGVVTAPSGTPAFELGTPELTGTIAGGGDDGRLRYFGDDGGLLYKAWVHVEYESVFRQVVVHSYPRSLACPGVPVCPGDFNNDGGIDGEDVSLFYSYWENGGCEADLDCSGATEGVDVEIFFNYWEEGESRSCCR